VQSGSTSACIQENLQIVSKNILFQIKQAIELICTFFPQATDECDPESTSCENNGGSYTCQCLPGYESAGNGEPMDIILRNQVLCIDINECEVTPEARTYCILSMDVYCFNVSKCLSITPMIGVSAGMRP
jgi:hypothetical protein